MKKTECSGDCLRCEHYDAETDSCCKETRDKRDDRIKKRKERPT